MNHFDTWNPATEEKINTYTYMSERDIVRKIEKLSSSFDIWKRMSIDQRIIWLESYKNNLKSSIPELSAIVTETMGKPLVESKLEIEKCITQFEYYIKNGPELVKEKSVDAHYPDTRVNFAPMGVVFSVMPWNYPAWQFFRFAVGAWLAGNVILFKHSEITTEVGLFLEKLAEQTQGPTLLQTIILNSDQSEFIFAHKSVRAVTFTGSSKVGRRIGELCGKYLKKSVLELGGNDSFVVDTTADIRKAAKLAVSGRLLNNGQSCIASKRFFVPRGKETDFMNAVQMEINEYVVGSPLDKKTNLGPLAHRRFFDDYKNHVQFLKSIASLQTESLSLSADKGYFVSPLFFLLEKGMNDKGSEVYRFFQTQEIFSPVGMVTTYGADEELWSLVNDSPYGLGAVWVGDAEKFKKEKLHLKFDVGMISVNEILKSDARVPFGGAKDSGYGRESGEFGIREFCNTQSLGIK
tara:strand:+ start:84138 stop:85529 length:1392 start_codon:yes stop_codon:yes gene_type:complete